MRCLVRNSASFVTEMGHTCRNLRIWDFFEKLGVSKKSLSIRFDSERFVHVNSLSKGYFGAWANFSAAIRILGPKLTLGPPKFGFLSKSFHYTSIVWRFFWYGTNDKNGFITYQLTGMQSLVPKYHFYFPQIEGFFIEIFLGHINHHSNGSLRPAQI